MKSQREEHYYLIGYADPEFIESLQHLSLPFLKNGGKYRAFPVEGDSMPPFDDGSFVIGKYIEDHQAVKGGKTYILLTLNEGIVYKRIYKKDAQILTLASDNTYYEPYDIRHSDILETWEFACVISTHEGTYGKLEQDDIWQMFRELKREIAQLKKD